MHFWVRCFVWQDPPASFAYTRQAAAYPRYGSSLAPLAGEGRGERVLSNELEEPAAQPFALLERLAQLLIFRDHVIPAQTHATDHGHESGGARGAGARRV